MSHIRRAVFAMVVALVLTACAPALVPTPTPTFECTPEGGGELSPCSEADHQAMLARDAVYAEAERVFRRSIELEVELPALKQPVNDELRSLLSTKYAESLEPWFLELANDPEYHESGMPEIVWVKRVQVSRAGSEIALDACAAPGTWTWGWGDNVKPASYRLHRALFEVTDDGVVKRRAYGAEDVDEC